MTFFEKNSLKERVLVSEHQAFVSSIAVGGLEVVQIRFVHPNGFLELFDILGPALAKRGLCLSVSLLALL
jgi:hypothetical protein